MSCIIIDKKSHKICFTDKLDTIREYLFGLKARIEQRMQHPKIVAVCKEIDVWLKKKRIKSKDQEQKVCRLVL